MADKNILKSKFSNKIFSGFRFEGSRSCTPERRSCTPDRGINALERRAYTPESRVYTPDSNVTPGKGGENKQTSSTPTSPGETSVPDILLLPTGETQPEPESSSSSVSNQAPGANESQTKDISLGAVPKKLKNKS